MFWELCKKRCFMAMQECWKGDDLKVRLFAGSVAGAAIGAIGDGVGALPGAGVGAIMGIADWAAINTLYTVTNACAVTKNLPPVTIDGTDKK
jgi:hypothetical protein